MSYERSQKFPLNSVRAELSPGLTLCIPDLIARLLDRNPGRHAIQNQFPAVPPGNLAKACGFQNVPQDSAMPKKNDKLGNQHCGSCIS